MSIVKEYLRRQSGLLICLSGLSGAGKTYHAKQLADRLNLVHIDQDSFFKNYNELPQVTLGNGTKMPNWDSQDAIDFDLMNKSINRNIKNGLILSGFACRNEWFECQIDCQIHLKIDKETCYERRREQHKDPPHLAQRIIDEVVYPFYLETLESSHFDFIIDTNQKSNQTLDLLADFIYQFLKEKLTTE